MVPLQRKVSFWIESCLVSPSLWYNPHMRKRLSNNQLTWRVIKSVFVVRRKTCDPPDGLTAFRNGCRIIFDGSNYSGSRSAAKFQQLVLEQHLHIFFPPRTRERVCAQKGSRTWAYKTSIKVICFMLRLESDVSLDVANNSPSLLRSHSFLTSKLRIFSYLSRKSISAWPHEVCLQC